MRKVVHITTVHQTFDVRIFHREAVSLAASGFEVVLIAQAETAATVKGVRIKPLGVPRNRWERMTRTAWHAYRSANAEGADLYHFHDPELIPVGLLLKMKGKRVIYDVHEDVSKDINDKAYLPAWSRTFVRAGVKILELLAITAFDQIVAATSAIERNFPSNKVTLIRNVPLVDELAVADGTPFAARPRKVVYVGGLAPFNGVEQMIRAMGMLPVDANIRLILGGKFASSADEETMRALPGWERVDYVGYVDRARLRALFASARAGLVVYQPTPNIMESEPNKFFEILSAGLPLIASDLPHWRKFIAEYACGVVVRPSDPDSIANAILDVVNRPCDAEEMGRRGRKAVVGEYNWEVDCTRLVALYKRLLSDRAMRSVLT